MGGYNTVDLMVSAFDGLEYLKNQLSTQEKQKEEFEKEVEQKIKKQQQDNQREFHPDILTLVNSEAEEVTKLKKDIERFQQSIEEFNKKIIEESIKIGKTINSTDIVAIIQNYKDIEMILQIESESDREKFTNILLKNNLLSKHVGKKDDFVFVLKRLDEEQKLQFLQQMDKATIKSFFTKRNESIQFVNSLLSKDSPSISSIIVLILKGVHKRYAKACLSLIPKNDITSLFKNADKVNQIFGSLSIDKIKKFLNHFDAQMRKMLKEDSKNKPMLLQDLTGEKEGMLSKYIKGQNISLSGNSLFTHKQVGAKESIALIRKKTKTS